MPSADLPDCGILIQFGVLRVAVCMLRPIESVKLIIALNPSQERSDVTGTT